MSKLASRKVIAATLTVALTVTWAAPVWSQARARTTLPGRNKPSHKEPQAEGNVTYKNKTEYWKAQAKEKGVTRPSVSRTRMDPITPVFVHSLQRYLNGAPDPSPVDRIIWDSLKRRPQVTRQVIKQVVDKWNSLPADARARRTPMELRNLNPLQKLDMAVYEKALRRAVAEQAPQPAANSPSGAVLTKPGKSEITRPMLSGASTGGPIVSNMPGMGPVPGGQSAPPPPKIVRLEPAGVDTNAAFIRIGEKLTVIGQNLWNGQVQFYPATGPTTKPVDAISPTFKSAEKFEVTCPNIPPGQYRIQVEQWSLPPGSGTLALITRQKSNFVMAQVAPPLNPPIVFAGMSPQAQYPGKTVIVNGDRFVPGIALSCSPVKWDTSQSSYGDWKIKYLNAKQMELLVPQNAPPGDYTISFSAAGAGLSEKRVLKVRAPQYKVEFQRLECIDESDPEWGGSDEIATFWVIGADGKAWSKNTGSYDGFDGGDSKPYISVDKCVFLPGGGPAEVTNYLAISTRLMEIDAGSVKSAIDYLDSCQDWLLQADDYLPGIGQIATGFYCFVLEFISGLISVFSALFGCEPDDLGQRDLAWTAVDLQMKTGNPNRSFTGQLLFQNPDSVGSYCVIYSVTRSEKP